MDNIAKVTGIDKYSAAFPVVSSSIGELCGMIARANGLLHHEEELQVNSVSTTVIASISSRHCVTRRSS
jgi:hypothetical protein